MEQRLSLLTLVTDDLARIRRWHAALGWREATDPAGPVAVWNLGALALMRCPRAVLAEELGRDPGAGGGAVTLAHNVSGREDVARLHAAALRAGATEVAAPTERAWGGLSSYVADPDGHVWEICWNPGAPLGPGGALHWPEAMDGDGDADGGGDGDGP